jgi:hypothetical protein
MTPVSQINSYLLKETTMFWKLTLSAAMLASCAGIVRAAGQDDVQAAFQKLADSPNYSWKTTVTGGFGAGETDGKTQKDGLTLLSITRQDTTYDVVIQGGKAAGKTPDGWKSAAELTADAGNGGGGNGGPTPGRFIGMMARNFKTPVAIAQDMLGKLQNLQQTDGVYSADLSEDAAKAALSFRRPGANGGGAPAPEVSNAKASVKVWIKDGAVTKVENHVTGTVTFNGNDRDVDRTSTTEFSDVGSTTITVPDEAKAKLAAAPATQPAGN